MGFGEKLKETSKGRLSYERRSSGQSLKSLLDECSSPPSLHVSPTLIQNLKLQKERGIPSDGEEKKDQEKEPEYSKLIRNNTRSFSSRSSDASLPDKSERHPVKEKVVSPEYEQSKLAIQKYEEVVKQQTMDLWSQKRLQFQAVRARLEGEAMLTLQQLEQQTNFNTLMKIQDIELRHESQAAEIVRQHKLLKETHEQRRQAHNACILEAEQEKNRLKQELLRKKEQENKERLEKMISSLTSLSQMNTKVQDLMNQCKYQNLVTEATKKSAEFIQKKIAQGTSDVSERRKEGQVDLVHLEKMHELLKACSNAYEFIKAELDKVEKEGKQAEEKAKLEQQKQQQLKQQQQVSPVRSAPLATSTPMPDTGPPPIPEGQSLCADVEAFKQYMELQKKLTTVEEALQVLTSTPQLKKLKFDLQKAINTPINAISPVSGDHLRDKLKRLLSLLNGNTVEVAGRSVSASQHQAGQLFCKYLIAKMFVRKGEEQVTSKHDSAFAIAMVAVALWGEHRDMGDMYQAQFTNQCPYLVPYYAPRLEGQTDEEYFKSRGYKYEDGSVEKQDKFLKRMSGIMRLYFAMIVSSPARGAHPHGIEHGWRWFSRVLNLEPEPDISATMIFDFLQVAGHAMYRQYQKQFLKHLHILTKEMFVKLKNVSSPAGAGVLTRLQTLLETALKHQGNIPEPDGFLAPSFWRS